MAAEHPPPALATKASQNLGVSSDTPAASPLSLGDVKCGGFDEELFVDEVPSHFKCPICLDVLRDPLICKEEHAFCCSCIRHYLTTRGSKCPECKTSLAIKDLLPPPRLLRNLLDELMMRCANHAAGCPEVMKLSAAEAHERHCPFGQQLCRFCRKPVPAKTVAHHEDRCEDRSEVCRQDCGLRVFPNRAEAHNCVAALKARMAHLSAQLEQQHIDFQYRLAPYQEYVRCHEAGQMDSWREVQRRIKAAGPASIVEHFPTTRSPRQQVKRTDTFLRHGNKRQVKVLDLKLDPLNKGANVEFRDNNMTMTSMAEDSGGCAAGLASLSNGAHYWEVRIEALWDSTCSDGSVRVGVALDKPEFHGYELGLGDDSTTIGWFDSTVDGATYRELGGESLKMQEGQHLGLLLDLNRFRLEFYIDKTYVGEVALAPGHAYVPAFYTRTHFDRLTIVSNPTLPENT